MARSCGECSLCCKLLGISELDKPAGKWCPHCRPGSQRCLVYEARPRTCRTYACGWLVNPKFDDAWYPARCKIVVSMNVDRDPHVMQIYVDLGRRDAWDREPYRSGIRELAANGRNGMNGEFYKTEVHLFGPREIIGID